MSGADFIKTNNLFSSITNFIKNNKNIIKEVLIIIDILIFAILNIYLILLNIIPIKIYILLIYVLLSIKLLSIFLICVKNKLLNIIGSIIIFLSIILYIIGIVFCNQTKSFIDSSFKESIKEVSTYGIYVLNNEPSLNFNKIGYLKNDVININDCLKESNISINYQLIAFDDIFTLYDALETKKVSAIIIDNIYIDILRDENIDITKISNNVYSKKIEKTIKTNNSNENSNFTIYLSGSDDRNGNISDKSRSDVNIVIAINNINKEILLVSIPRDYYVNVYGTTGLKDKLSHSGIYGTDISTKTIENLLNINIDYNIKVGFKSLEKIVDLLGGIDIYSEISFKSKDNPKLIIKKGNNHLNGELALAYSRERHVFAAGDRQRIKNQQKVLKSIIDKATSTKSIISNYNKLLNEFSNLYKTNMPKEIIINMLKEELVNNKKWNIESYYLNGYDAREYTKTSPRNKRYVMTIDENSIKECSNLLNKYKKESTEESA